MKISPPLPIEIGDVSAGLALRERGGFSFVAADPALPPAGRQPFPPPGAGRGKPPAIWPAPPASRPTLSRSEFDERGDRQALALIFFVANRRHPNRYRIFAGDKLANSDDQSVALRMVYLLTGI